MLSDWSMERAGRGMPVESAVSEGKACNAELGNDETSDAVGVAGTSREDSDKKMSAALLIIGDEILNLTLIGKGASQGPAQK